MPKASLDHASLRNAAIRLLAQREYSRKELGGRLSRQAPASLVRQVLDELVEEGLQSDQRYALSLLHARVARGQGPVRIRQEMQHKGLESELVAATFEAEAVDWEQLACEVWQRRFGGESDDGPPAGADAAKQSARQLRFMLYRGFTPEQARRALRCSK